MSRCCVLHSRKSEALTRTLTHSLDLVSAADLRGIIGTGTALRHNEYACCFRARTHDGVVQLTCNSHPTYEYKRCRHDNSRYGCASSHTICFRLAARARKTPGYKCIQVTHILYKGTAVVSTRRTLLTTSTKSESQRKVKDSYFSSGMKTGALLSLPTKSTQ